jgi:DNA-binding NarL/FixJ family response regulator
MAARAQLSATFEHAEPMDSPVTISVLLVHRNGPVRRQLRRILEGARAIHVVGDVRNVAATRTAASLASPRVLVTDVAIRGALSSAAERPGAAADAPGIVLVTRHVDRRSLHEGLRAGALSYVIEDSIDADLVAGVRAAAAGRCYLSSPVQRALVDGCLARSAPPSGSDPVAQLTGREREILQLIAEGRRPQEIGRLLEIAPTTVDTHRRALMAKLGLHNVAQVVRFAMRSRIVS